MTWYVQDYLDKLSLQEKVSLLSGANFWHTKALPHAGIPAMMLTDGPHGLRKQAGRADHLGLSESVPATCFPTAAALANSWDEQLLEEVGRALGHEAAANDVNVLLGPGLNIVRDPLGGRNFEYFSEDPYITGKLAAAIIRGIQSTGVAATPKHFAVNSQEHLRMSIDEIVDERTLREIYLEGFRHAVQEGKPRMLMTSYNKVNGYYTNEHPHLLQGILVGEWRYKGALVTDWGGNHDPVAAIKTGGALEMPSTGGLSEKKILRAVELGEITEATIDARVTRLVELALDTSKAIANVTGYDKEAHHGLAVEAAERSLVLLQNERQLLPLTDGTRVALIGDFALSPRYQGAGSSLVNPTRLVSAAQAFEEESALDVIGYASGFHRAGKESARLRRQAVTLAREADVAVVFLGLDESKEAEGLDRTTMALPDNQLALIEELTKVHDRIVVVLAAGGPIELPFADKVQAIIHGSLSGQGVGSALASVITGRRNPSGKLAVSYPHTYQDTPTARYFPGKERTSEHREGLYVGYRYYETAQQSVRFPFGHGLSYAEFTYEDIQAGQNDVSFTLTNVGQVAGEEIAQVYIAPPKGKIFRPVRELKGFVKVALQPGESRRVTVALDDRAFAHYNTMMGGWQVEGGEYTIEVGASVCDIRLRHTFHVFGNESPSNYDPLRLRPYFEGRVLRVPDSAFSELLGRPLPPATWDRRAPLTLDDTVDQLQYGTLRGRTFRHLLRLIRRLAYAFGNDVWGNNMLFILNMPLTKLPGFTGGKVSERAIRFWLGVK